MLLLRLRTFDRYQIYPVLSKCGKNKVICPSCTYSTNDTTCPTMTTNFTVVEVSKSPRNCRKCLFHGILVPSGPEHLCEFKNCVCDSCKIVTMREAHRQLRDVADNTESSLTPSIANLDDQGSSSLVLIDGNERSVLPNALPCYRPPSSQVASSEDRLMSILQEQLASSVKTIQEIPPSRHGDVIDQVGQFLESTLDTVMSKRDGRNNLHTNSLVDDLRNAIRNLRNHLIRQGTSKEPSPEPQSSGLKSEREEETNNDSYGDLNINAHGAHIEGTPSGDSNKHTGCHDNESNSSDDSIDGTSSEASKPADEITQNAKLSEDVPTHSSCQINKGLKRKRVNDD